MSMRRFVAYFLAISASSIVAFASTLMGSPPPVEATATETLSASSQEHTAEIFRAMRNRAPYKPSDKSAQVALRK